MGTLVHEPNSEKAAVPAGADDLGARIVASMTDCVKILDLQGNLLQMNELGQRLLGICDLQPMLGTFWPTFWKGEDYAAAVEAIRTANSGQPAHFEGFFQTLDGIPKWWDVVVTAIRGTDGKPEKLLAISRDISERRHADAVNETVLSSITDFAFTFDRDGRFIYANKALLDLWGLKLKDAVGKNCFDLKYPDDLAARLQNQIQQVVQDKKPISGRTPYTSPTGISGIYEYIFTPVLRADGSVECVVGSARDITEQHRMVQALQHSEENFRQLADAMPQIVWAAQADGALDYYNRRWFDYINLDAADMERARWDRYIHPEDLPRAFETWTQVLRSGRPYSIEFRVRRADGEYRWFLARALAIRNSQGDITRWFGTCTDIHDQRELQAQKENLLESERAARGAAEHASRMKDEFLATLSHELRTPLNAILGWAQLLRGGDMGEEDLKQGLETIERNARVQTQLIEDLLDMSRIISGKMRLDVQTVKPAAVIEAAMETVMPAASAKGIRIEKMLDPLAGPVSGDVGRLQQVIWNLLSNAIKFTPRGGTVQVILERVNSHLEISVSDTGQGIAVDFLPHVFDRFRQEDSSSSRKHNGLGLGLAIVKQLVELHGGNVRVKSGGENQGATFVVSLPLKAAHSHVENDRRIQPGAPRLSAADCARASLAGLTVLVVDDENDARMLLKRILEECKAQVITAGSAAEALRLLESNRPHVLVSDIGMPDVDGYELLRRIRATTPKDCGPIPAVALTAFARSEDRTRALLAGYFAHVAKPVEPSELVATIAAVAGRIGEQSA